MTLDEKLKELEESYCNNPECCEELKLLAHMLQKAIEQRNEMYQVEFGENSDWEKDANAELNRIAKEKNNGTNT